MIRNFVKIAIRNLQKNKLYSLLNIFGLALGMVCFVLITLYVTDELSYDRFHKRAEDIYRINSDIRFGGTDLIMAVSSDPMGETLKKDYPQVEEYVRLYASSGAKLIRNGNEFVNEEKVVHADSTLFKVFTLPVITGNERTALNNPNSVVITRSAAKRYFGSPELALGKTLETDDAENKLYEVTAVIEDIPKNSHFHFDFFFSMHNVRYRFGNFLSHNFHTYVLLKPGTDYKKFNSNFNEFIEKYILPQAQHFMNIKTMSDFEASGNKLEYSLIPVTDIHLYSSRDVELEANGNIQYVYIFSAIALFILIIACINFMNLSTARSAARAKEVGVRKVLGSERKSLIAQFLTESVLMAFLALVLAIGLTVLILPWFNGIAGKQMEIDQLYRPEYIVFLLLLPFVVGMVAGAYPAFYLSSFKPVSVLKSKFNSGVTRSYFRNALVVFQFTTSIVLIIGTIIIFNQLSFIQKSNVGFNKEQVLIIDNGGLTNPKRQTFKQEIEALSDVRSASFGGYLPVSESSRSDNTFSTEAVMTESNSFNMQAWRVDYDYIPTMGMELAKGRNFSKEFGSDSLGIIINETAAALLGPGDPIGKTLYQPDDEPGSFIPYEVIGVVKNFNFESLRERVGPLSLRLGNNSWVSVYRVETTDMKEFISKIENRYREMAPGMPFNYRFLDESFDNMYRQEQRVGRVAFSFAVLAIIIACLGLFGLATYIAEQRVKEIGIRKVLGASVMNIVTMLSGDFLKLVLIAFLIAIPIAWWAMNKWLEDFEYRIDIGWGVFFITGGIAILIAMLTVSFQAIKAAIANPVKNLRTE